MFSARVLLRSAPSCSQAESDPFMCTSDKLSDVVIVPVYSKSELASGEIERRPTWFVCPSVPLQSLAARQPSSLLCFPGLPTCFACRDARLKVKPLRAHSTSGIQRLESPVVLLRVCASGMGKSSNHALKSTVDCVATASNV